MSLSYAGISLLLETPEVREYLDRFHSLDRLVEESLGGIPGPGLQHVNAPNYRIAEPIRVGVLLWPTGATQCATFHAVVNSTKLDQIRAVVDADGPYQILSMDDGNQAPVECWMRQLPPRPLFQIASTEQLYLLSLVDVRYDLTHFRTGNCTATGSWSSLFSQLASELGITLSVSVNTAEVFTPSSRWNLYSRPLAAVLDAAASTVGKRIVANLDGTFKAVDWEDALADSDLQYAEYRKCGGGAIQQADIRRAAPAAVVTVFSHVEGGVQQSAPYTVTKTLSGLSVTGYSASTGITDNVATVYADLVYTGSNATDCDTYATACAKNWYGWQLADLDVTLTGIVPWQPTGAESEIEWTYSLTGPGPRLHTRIQRGPWDGFPTGDWTIDENGSGSGSTNCTKFKTTCEQGYLRLYQCVDGEYQYLSDLGVPCQENPQSGSPGSGPGEPTQQITRFRAVSTVCPQYAACVKVTSDYTISDPNLYLIQCDATTAPITVTLPAWADGAYFAVMKSDSSGNTVTVQKAGSDTINGGSSKIISSQWYGYELQALCESGKWWANAKNPS